MRDRRWGPRDATSRSSPDFPIMFDFPRCKASQRCMTSRWWWQQAFGNTSDLVVSLARWPPLWKTWSDPAQRRWNMFWMTTRVLPQWKRQLWRKSSTHWAKGLSAMPKTKSYLLTASDSQLPTPLWSAVSLEHARNARINSQIDQLVGCWVAFGVTEKLCKQGSRLAWMPSSRKKLLPATSSPFSVSQESLATSLWDAWLSAHNHLRA